MLPMGLGMGSPTSRNEGGLPLLDHARLVLTTSTVTGCPGRAPVKLTHIWARPSWLVVSIEDLLVLRSLSDDRIGEEDVPRREEWRDAQDSPSARRAGCAGRALRAQDGGESPWASGLDPARRDGGPQLGWRAGGGDRAGPALQCPDRATPPAPLRR